MYCVEYFLRTGTDIQINVFTRRLDLMSLKRFFSQIDSVFINTIYNAGKIDSHTIAKHHTN